MGGILVILLLGYLYYYLYWVNYIISPMWFRSILFDLEHFIVCSCECLLYTLFGYSLCTFTKICIFILQRNILWKLIMWRWSKLFMCSFVTLLLLVVLKRSSYVVSDLTYFWVDISNSIFSLIILLNFGKNKFFTSKMMLEYWIFISNIVP